MSANARAVAATPNEEVVQLLDDLRAGNEVDAYLGAHILRALDDLEIAVHSGELVEIAELSCNNGSQFVLTYQAMQRTGDQSGTEGLLKGYFYGWKTDAVLASCAVAALWPVVDEELLEDLEAFLKPELAVYFRSPATYDKVGKIGDVQEAINQLHQLIHAQDGYEEVAGTDDDLEYLFGCIAGVPWLGISLVEPRGGAAPVSRWAHREVLEMTERDTATVVEKFEVFWDKVDGESGDDSSGGQTPSTSNPFLVLLPEDVRALVRQ